MKKKIASIVICMLMFVTVSTVTGTVNNDNFTKIIEPKVMSKELLWSDDFEDYELYQFLDGTGDDGGWEGWDNTPAAGAFVTNNESKSPEQSVEIVDDSDLVHRYSGVSSGSATYTAWQYIPEDFEGETYFILLNTYDPPTHHWSTQIRFSSIDGLVSSETYGGIEESLPLITGEWVEIRVEIDFESDTQTIFYGGDELEEKSWSEGVSGPGGLINLAAVDLWGNLATEVYYDDMSLEGEASADPDLFCEGTLSWVNQTPGDTLTGSFTVENVGGAGTQLDWEVTNWPSWGEWSFDPASGTDLTPEDGQITVDVTCIAPDDKNEEFIGKIKVENLEDSEDTCDIDVSLTTPLVKPLIFIQVIEKIMQRFPVLAKILQFSQYF